MTTTAGELANRHAGVIEAAIRKSVEPGMILRTVPARAPFKVQKLSEGALVLLFGKKRTPTTLPWPCLESAMRLLMQGDWIEIRSVHDVEGVPGSLDGHIKSNGGPARATGGYVAAVLEAAKVVDVDLNRPARVRLSRDIVDNGGLTRSEPRVSEAGSADPFSRVYGALKGTVVIAPGTDLTAPVGEEWGAAR